MNTLSFISVTFKIVPWKTELDPVCMPSPYHTQLLRVDITEKTGGRHDSIERQRGTIPSGCRKVRDLSTV